jgi:hypothetical protein
MIEARRMVRRHYGRDHHPARRKLAQVLVTITWLPSVIHSLWQLRDWFGPRKAVLARVPGALWAAIRHNILPVEYYMYQLWEPDRRTNVDNYLYVNESPRLFKVLNRKSKVDPISDKLAFYELCKTHGIPTPEVLAVFGPTGPLVESWTCLPPQQDLFVKARIGVGGAYAERLRWDGGLFQSDRGCQLRPEDLGDYLANRARSENLTLLVQPALSNHPDICSQPNEALATARLVTGRSIHGDIMPICCYMYWARPDKITSHSNWITLVDLTNGRLLPAPPNANRASSIYQTIFEYRRWGNDDRLLPDWQSALRHVKAAHKACFNFVFIGWDVAFTPDGAMVLEGNANWAPSTYQTLRGEPLGLTSFSDVLATHLGQKWACRT